jgi:(1->4)-alpha-D-glucan 1-alpha-D-glucosylmutase
MSKAPTSTYRLQLHSDFTFADASRVADYISALGISHVYSSPILQATAGSTHGYDVVDFKSVNHELGGESGLETFSARLSAVGLGMVLDIVPNHMSLAPTNPYWRDVLENGPLSRYSDYFDIGWASGEERFHNKVLLPLLSDQYGVILSSGAIKVVRSGARLEITFADMRLPVAPFSTSEMLASAAMAIHSETLLFIAESLGDLAGHDMQNPAALRRMRRSQTVLLSLLTRYVTEKPEVLAAIDDAVAELNTSTDGLHNFLQKQHYRLAYWKAANQDLDYRRFFDVNSLIGMRVEDEDVFTDTHELIFRWLDAGLIDGVRVDHVDGLRDPQLYLERLRARFPGAWIVAEKILARAEPLRSEWTIEGTTGYDFLNVVSGLLVSPIGMATLEKVYQNIVGPQADYQAMVHEKKLAIMDEGLGSDVNRLTGLFLDICECDRNYRDYTRTYVRRALREVAAHFSVYRTYVQPDRKRVIDLDASIIQAATQAAAQSRPEIDRGLFDLIADVLLLRKVGRLETEFVMQFQQFTGPVMAKGFEDTALYCYNRLVGLNDVGSNPRDPLVSVADFHRFNQQAQAAHPNGQLALTTHDTKRGEDVRARLFVISECAEAFEAKINNWFARNSHYRDSNMPDPNTEYLYYQTLIGAWPLTVDRALGYMEKATREAKLQTSWTHQNPAFESRLQQFIRDTFGDAEFIADVASFVTFIDKAGRVNSLIQTLLKCTSPGVPDLYQGSELWDHRLVDPDNRGPVDYQQRRELMDAMRKLSPAEILEQMDSGMPKLWLLHKALHVRSRYPQCFGATGNYLPLEVKGAKSEQVVAFARGGCVSVIVPRLTFSMNANMQEAWQDTRVAMAEGRWRSALNGKAAQGAEASVSELLQDFPVALLVKED